MIRRILPVFGTFCCLCGAFAVLPPVPHPLPFILDSTPDRVVSSERVSVIEQRVEDMKGYGDRLLRLEMSSEHHTEQLDQILWLGRWMGIALLAAVFDKVLGVIGLGSVADRVKKRIERNNRE